MKTFIEKCVDDTAHVTQIDNYISQWHRSNSNESLHEYLGMTFTEYMEWIQNPNTLENIIKEKKLLK